jgi:excisionase family DNA binding protein
MNDNLIGIKEMAKKLDVPVSWLYSRTRTKEIPFYRIGKYCKFNESEVMDWVKGQNENKLFCKE